MNAGITTKLKTMFQPSGLF